MSHSDEYHRPATPEHHLRFGEPPTQHVDGLDPMYKLWRPELAAQVEKNEWFAFTMPGTPDRRHGGAAARGPPDRSDGALIGSGGGRRGGARCQRRKWCFGASFWIRAPRA